MQWMNTVIILNLFGERYIKKNYLYFESKNERDIKLINFEIK